VTPLTPNIVALVLAAASTLTGAENVRNPGVSTSRAAAVQIEGDITFDQFLDRLMMAESGGKAFAKNPKSTAIGPFQFIASTWLQIANKHFGDETKDLKPHEVLRLRTDMALARRAARIYSEDNAAFLVANGHKATFPHLRLAFLVGPGGAIRVLGAKSETPVATLLGATVIGANPFMSRMTAEDLVRRAARDISTDHRTVAGLEPSDAAVRAAGAAGKGPKAAPRVAVACDLSLTSCRRWLALATKRQARVSRLKNKKESGG